MGTKKVCNIKKAGDGLFTIDELEQIPYCDLCNQENKQLFEIDRMTICQDCAQIYVSEKHKLITKLQEKILKSMTQQKPKSKK